MCVCFFPYPIISKLKNVRKYLMMIGKIGFTLFISDCSTILKPKKAKNKLSYLIYFKTILTQKHGDTRKSCY